MTDRRLRAVWVLALLLAACGPEGVDSTTITAVVAPTIGAAPSTTSSTVTSTTATTVTATTDSSTTTAGDVGGPEFVVRVEGEEVEGGGRHSVPQGSEVRLEVHADIEEEVHLHGYDLTAEVAPGSPAELVFVADIPGIFEVELEGSHRELMELEVTP